MPFPSLWKSAVSSAALLGLGIAIPAAQAQVAMPQAQVDALEGLFGVQPTFRRSGAKGVCASGYFIGNDQGQALSSAAVFSGARVPVVARFSIGGGSPKASDKGRSVRGLALAMTLPTGQQWQMANISAPVFFVAKPEQFAPFLQARSADPATGKPNPEKLKTFNDANPETMRQGAYLAKAPVPASYGTAQYWSTNAFELVNARNESRFVRWQFVPEAGTVGLTDDEMKTKPDDFLADELRQRVQAKPVTFNFQFQLAAQGDPLEDPTQAWPDSRQTITAGRLVIDAVAPGAGGECDKMTYNPLVLPAGIKPSKDPVLLARATPYALSLGRRLTEQATR
ncbi:MAG: catalase family peroxidase [Burkholderiales bacterium]